MSSSDEEASMRMRLRLCGCDDERGYLRIEARELEAGGLN